MNKNILIADDCKLNRALLRGVIESCQSGIDIIDVASGETISTLIRERGITFIFLDLNMPYEGRRVIADLEDNGSIKKIRVVVVTGEHLEDKTIRKFIEQGVYAVIRKPFNLSQLKNTIIDIFNSSLKSSVRVKQTIYENGY